MATRRRVSIPSQEPQISLFKLNSTPQPETYRKAVQVVHSKPRAPMTLVQRRLLNRWLKNAMESSPDNEGFYSIRVSDMADDIGYDSRNRQHLKESAENLMRIVFEWDVIANEKKRVLWKASVLFPEVEIRSDGVVRYQISSQLRDKVLSPEMYALIDMNVVKKLRRAPSIPLYEHCVRFVKIKKTAEVPWAELRDILLGESSGNKTYVEYKYFKAKVLVPCIAEINAETELNIALIESKQGRKITALRFDVDYKSASPGSPFKTEAHLEVVGEMIKMGLMQSEALRLIERYGEESAKAAITYTRRRAMDKKQPPLENPAAYLRRALMDGYGVIDVDAKVAQGAAKPSLEEQYAAHQQKEVAGYFRELDAAEQSTLIERYNKQQQTAALRIHPKKVGRAAEVAFHRWLALDTWGEPSSDDLLAFARRQLEGTGRGSPTQA